MVGTKSVRKRSQFLHSITARLILGLTLGTTVLWSAASAYSTYISYHELNEAFDHALQAAAHRLLPLATDDVSGHEPDDARAIEHFNEGQREYLSYQLRDASGRVVLRTHDAPIEPYDKIASPGFSTVGNYRLFTDTDTTTGLTIIVAETTRGRWEAVLGAARAMLWPLAALIPLNVFGIWLVVRKALKPVQRLSDDIATRGGTNLAALDISDQPGELQPIAQAVARLLERLHTALDAERAFAATSAHELRTPIAGALAQTQRMLADLGHSKDRRRALDMEATLKRLSGLAEKLLQLSRADASISLGEEDVDLIPVLDLIIDDCTKRLGEPYSIHYIKPEGARLISRMDIDAFAIAVRNLIDNAAHHGRSGGTIEIKVDSEGGIHIRNEGSVVPEDVLVGLKRRFIRGETRSAGSGLGLAIVETIMNQSGGTLDLTSPVPGRDDGFEALIKVNCTQYSSPVSSRS